MTREEPSVELTFERTPEQVAFHYTVVNTSPGPILLFDRMFDPDKGALDPFWGYVQLDGEEAVLARRMVVLPRGLHVESPFVPYAREIASGDRATGTMRMALPLKEQGPYDHILKRGRTPEEVTITSVRLEIGWCPKPAPEALPPISAPSTMEGEPLLFLPYGLVAQVQRVKASAPVSARFAGIDLR